MFEGLGKACKSNYTMEGAKHGNCSIMLLDYFAAGCTSENSIIRKENYIDILKQSME